MRRARHSLAALLATALSVVVIFVGCTDRPAPTATEVDGIGPSLAISDAVHSGGTDGFYFLPPLVPPPSYGGTFDASLAPTVHICEWVGLECGAELAVFTTETGPGSETVRMVPEDEHYIVNWHTDDFDLEPSVTYRIRVLVAGSELGFADVDVVSGGNELKNVATGEYIPLKDGRTLPISFRIEQGAVFVVGDGGGTISAQDGLVEMALPAGALPPGEELGITVEPVPDAGLPSEAGLIPGSVFDFEPDGTEFLEPVQLTLSYDETAIPPGLSESDLTLLTEGQDGLWVELPGSVVDEAANAVTGWISGFSAKGVGAEIAVIAPPPDFVLFPGDTIWLEITALDASGTPVERGGITLTSGDPSIVTTHELAVVGVAPGQATVLIQGGDAQETVNATVIPETLPRIGALVDDPLVGHLVGGTNEPTRSTLESSLAACAQVVAAGDAAGAADCLALARSQIADVTDPTDVALGAVLDLILAFAQGLLGS